MTRRLGRYELVHRLGAGGGGEVWEALLHGPAGFRRQVAVKLLKDGGSDPAAREALLQEARLGALVAHPNVVSTLELSEHDGRWFFVMDLVRGQSAASLGKRGPLPPGALLDVGIQVCDGLSHIHTLCDHDGWPLGLVHRDIKPGNLMIDGTHRVRIVDLGIARLTGTPEIPSGTPGFVAPEQLRGHEGPRADVFSLGATLIYLGIRVLPFGKGPRAVAQVLDPSADACATREELLAELDAYLPGAGPVLSRAIRADPEHRWPTAQAFRDALDGLNKACPSSSRLAAIPIPMGRRRSRQDGGMTTERGAFIGRDAEIEAMDRLLAGPDRWIALVGPGGVGKTRLLDQLTREMDVVRCDASKARSLPGLCFAVAEAVGGKVVGEPVASVAAALESSGTGWLVLDEVEQVVDAAVEAIPAWLAAVPGLRVVCSSRVAPSHPDAALVRVGPLPMEDARRLFELRLGGAADPKVVDPLLRALDRLPLAIELAASRARKTSPARVLAQLRSSSSAQVPSLREALEASWALLEKVDRRALVRLGSFVGPFDVQDAKAVLEPGEAPLERLERLVEHSMLHVRKNRFRLLTSVRDFARNQLPAERVAGDRRHGRWMARFGETSELRRAYASQQQARPLLAAVDDLLAASRRALAAGEADVAVATGLAACEVLHRTGPVSQIAPLVQSLMGLGRRQIELLRMRGRGCYASGQLDQAEQVLQEAADLADGLERCQVMLTLASVRFRLGTPGAAAMLEQALDELEAAGQGRYSVQGRNALGQVRYLGGELEAAEADFRAALGAVERHGLDPGHSRGMLAAVVRRRGRMAEATDLYRRAVRELEAGEDKLLQAVWLANFSFMLWMMGTADEAEDGARRALALARQVGRRPTMGVALTVLSQLAIDAGDRATARALAQECQAISEGIEDGNLACEAALAMARVSLLDGSVEEGLAFLEEAAAHGPRSEAETRAEIARWFAQHGAVERARTAIGEAEAQLAEGEPFGLAQCGLARAELELRQGRRNEARGALLQASAALATLQLPDHAPLPRAFARVREALTRPR